ncbi:MAG TPA: YncE family protein [Nitrososphaerales archaeon]|nr:YncE family protein [Nitrososphaerales archaeon]
MNEKQYSSTVLKLLVSISILLILILVSRYSVSAQMEGRVVTNIGVGGFPLGIAFDPNNGYIYVANGNCCTVSVLSGSTNTAIANITVGTIPFSFPAGIAFDSLDGNLYVADELTNNVSVINGLTNTVLEQINLGSGNRPSGVAFDSLNGCIYVTNIGSNTTSVINGSTDSVAATIKIGFPAYGVAFDPITGNVYLANSVSNRVSVLNTSSKIIIGEITVGYSPIAIAFDRSDGSMYVTNYNSSSVTVINGSTNTVVGTIGVGLEPAGVDVNPVKNYVFIANSLSNTTSVIDGSSNRVIANISVGLGPWGTAFDSLNGYVYIANSDSNTVSVVSCCNSSVTSTLISFNTTISSPSRESFKIGLEGNISSSEISNMLFSENPTSSNYSLSFSLNLAPDTTGYETLTIPKNAVPGGFDPIVYLDGTLASQQSYYSDSSNYYVTFSAPFYTHQVVVFFSFPNTSTTSTLTRNSNPNYLQYGTAAALTVVIVALGSFIILRIRKNKLLRSGLILSRAQALSKELKR